MSLTHVWYSVVVIALVLLALFTLDMCVAWITVTFVKPRPKNTYLQARERQQASDRLLEHFYPTSKGPHGFAGQNERRHRVSEFRSRKVN